jgi:teichuronic acid biosynthesis glycosyltransferase TuaG
MDKVSVIIPTYNRFSYLMNTIRSVRNQTHKNIEIIVVNDCSSEEEYYTHNWEDIRIIHLAKNSKSIFGYASAGYVRNKGIEIAQGKYVAFCDDDDIWFPMKIELQLNAMNETGYKMSCTDGLIGHGVYDSTKQYQKYNGEYYFERLQSIYENKGSSWMKHGFPKIWTLDFLKIHNCVICSSVLIEKSILDLIQNMKPLKNGEEDYNCWLRALEHTNLVYVEDCCFYYDAGHGYGHTYL